MKPRLSSLRAMFARPRTGRLAATAALALMLTGAGLGSAMAAPGDAASAPEGATASAAQAASASYSAGGQYTVKPGQSLNDVAIAVTQSHDRATLARAARAVFDANPNAFMGHDPSRMRLGAVLTVPPLDASGAVVAAAGATPAAAASGPAAGSGSSSNASVAAAASGAAQGNAAASAPGAETPATQAAPSAAPAVQANANGASDAGSEASAGAGAASSEAAAGAQPTSAASGTHVWAGSVQPSASEAASAGTGASQPRAQVSSLQQLLALKNRVLMELQKHGIGGSPAAPAVQSSASGVQPAAGASAPAVVSGHPGAAVSTSNQAGLSQTNLAVGAAVGAALVVLLTALRLGRRKRERLADAQRAEASEASEKAAAANDAAPVVPAAIPVDIAKREPEADAEDAATARHAATMAETEREAAEGDAAAREMSERIAAEREAEIRTATAREAEASEAAEQAAAQGAVEREAAERAIADEAAHDRIAAEQDLDAARLAAERLAAENAVTGASASEETAAQQAAADEATARQVQLASEQPAAERVAAHEPASEQADRAAPHEPSAAFESHSPEQPAAFDQSGLAPEEHRHNLDDATTAASLDAAAELGADALPRAPLQPFNEAWEPEPVSHRLEWDDEPLPPEPMEPSIPEAPATRAQVDHDQPRAPASAEFPRDALTAFGSLDMPLPPRVGSAAETVGAPQSLSSQPVASPEATARQAVPPPPNAEQAPHAADEIAAGTAGRGAVAGLGAGTLGAAGFGALKLDFDLELPPSPAQPLPAFTPADLARIARNKLDLAAEYIELGDLAGARTLINEVIEANDPATRNDARALLSTLAPLS
ncbi:fimbrial protein FimV [Paraburkholderia sp. RL17-368-BIF-A]|uniref:FimV/HubP family polar landmark protein n=1 Tax=Paraburkholderia sp. RL17-368-BIF-A TaxID=3031628 RepID=UPI0006B3F3F3